MTEKSKLKKKIKRDLISKKNFEICDLKNSYDYQFINKYFNEFKSNSKISNLKNKKVLAVINNKCSSFFWLNFIVSFLLDFTLMPNEKKNESYKKIRKYFDATIIFNGKKIKISENKKKLKNKIFKKIDYISSTSGSTGKPKMILHDIESIIKNSNETIKRVKYKKGDKFLISIPNYFNSAVCHFFTCLIKEITFYSNENIIFPNDLGNFIKKKKINYFGGAPLQTSWLLDLNFKIQHLKKIISSGDFLNKKVILKFLKKFKEDYELYNIYGITELGGRVFINCINKSKNPYSLGKELPHFKIKLKKTSNKIYELCIKSKYVFKGYFEDNINKDVLINNYFFTNDLITKRKREMNIVGRKNEIFKSSGIKIFPEMIKNEMLRMKNINNVFIFPKYIKNYGNVPIAAYQSKKKIDDDKIYYFLNKSLEKNHIPKEFVWYKKMPFLKNKKLDKLKIKNEFSSNKVLN